MNTSGKSKAGAELLRHAVSRDIFGEVECVTGSLDGWTVYLRDADDLPACRMQQWAGLPVKYTVVSGASA